MIQSVVIQQCLVVMKDDMDKEGYNDSRGKKTKGNLNYYTIKDAIFNRTEAWEKAPLDSLKNAWCKAAENTKKSCFWTE